MDLRQLRYFARVAELGSFTAAAGLLHVSQPALGMQIKKLEDELGVLLLQRHSRGVSTTSAGKLLLSHANEIFDRFEAALQSVQQHREGRGGAVRIGVTPAIGRALATTLLEHCTEHIEEVEVTFVQGMGETLPELTRADKVDIAFSSQNVTGPKWQSIPLFIEEFYFIGVPDLLKDLPDPVPFAQLIRKPLVIDGRTSRSRDFLARTAKTRGLALRDVVVSEAINIRREMVTRGRHCTICPYALFVDELHDGRLDSRHLDHEPWTQRTIFLNFRRSEDGSAVAEIRDFILRLVKDRLATQELGWLPLREPGYKQHQ